MPVTISFHRTAIDRVEAQIAAQPAASFEPAALMVDQPLFSQRPAPADPRAYGQRLFAALGGDTFRAALARLPRGLCEAKPACAGAICSCGLMGIEHL